MWRFVARTEDLPGEEGVSQEEILNFWRGDGGGDPKQESGDFCGWLGEIPTPIILLKDRLIGDKRGEEFLEGEKEGISFSSPEIPRGGNKEGIGFPSHPPFPHSSYQVILRFKGFLLVVLVPWYGTGKVR